ncbi:MAG: hypothetical protein U5O39_18920 [Gammaproteobacteria bacterium]|nr:hypothetical protein [Gammaproteobacteria bacterium]
MSEFSAPRKSVSAFAAQAGISLSYERIEAPKDAFESAVRRFVDEGARGFNVTIPFKHEAFELVDVVDASARRSEAVNTVVVEDGKLLGSNTDGAGLVTDLEVNLGWVLFDQQGFWLLAQAARCAGSCRLSSTERRRVFTCSIGPLGGLSIWRGCLTSPR